MAWGRGYSPIIWGPGGTAKVIASGGLHSSYLTETSAQFLISTAGYASGDNAQMTGNKVTLTEGTWVVNATISASWGSTPTWTHMRGLWATENGDNTASSPTAFSIQAGRSTGGWPLTTVSAMGFAMPTVRVVVTEDTDIYVVPRVIYTVTGTAFVQTAIYAEPLP